MPNPYISLLKTAWRYARTERKNFIIVYSLFALTNIVLAVNPILLGWFINKIQKDNKNILYYTGLYAAAYMGLKLLGWIFHGPARIMERKLAFTVSRNFLHEVYHQTLNLPIQWHKEHHSGSTINRIRKAYESLRHFFDGGFSYLHAIFKFIFSFGAMIYFSPVFGSIGVLLGALTIWVIFKFDKPFIKTLNDVNEKEHKISSNLFDSLSNILTVITLRLEKSMETGLMAKVKDLWLPLRKNILINEWKWFAADMLVALTYVVITFGFIYQNLEPGKVFYIGSLVTLLGYVTQFTSVFQDVALQYTQIVQFNTDVLTTNIITDAYKSQKENSLEHNLPVYWNSIEVKNLNFTHKKLQGEENKLPNLHGINLRIQRGQRIALIGESGSGKSTLLAALRGLYKLESCEIFIDDEKSKDLSTLRQSISLFPQEPEIFENTLLYNITLGLQYDEAQIIEVCDQAHLLKIIKQLPQGLNTFIHERGANLSGGQRQRLALARGILAARNSDLILLDEPTSSVDPITEALLYKNLFETFKDKAIISSLHRMHLLTQFDYIYVLKQGRIIDEGSFDYLMYNSIAFQEMWKHQEALQKGENLIKEELV